MLSVSSLAPFVIGVLVGGVISYFICQAMNQPKADLSDSLLSNQDAIDMIHNRTRSNIGGSVSGHLKLDILLTYIDKVQKKCKEINTELSGLEYYFAHHSTQKDDAWDEGSLTTIIFPTYRNGNDHVPFDPFVSSSSTRISIVELQGRLGEFGSSNHAALNRSNMSPPKEPLTL